MVQSGRALLSDLPGPSSISPPVYPLARAQTVGFDSFAEACRLGPLFKRRKRQALVAPQLSSPHKMCGEA